MTADSVWQPAASGPRDQDDVADAVDVQARTPADARHQRTAGAAGGEAQEAGPRSDQLLTSPPDGCAPVLVETAGTVPEPPEALLACWRQLCDEEGTTIDAALAVDHDASARCAGRPHRARHERAGEEGGAGGRGSSPRPHPVFQRR